MSRRDTRSSSVPRRAVLGVGAGVVALALATAGALSAGAIPERVAPAVPEDQSVMGLAAIAGAGNEVRHVMKVAGPDPTLAVTSSAPKAAGSAGGIAVAWHSGASGNAATDGSFGQWRGEPIQVVGTWSDTTSEQQTTVSALDAYRSFNGDVDVAIGALVAGESWSQAASGAYSSRWTTAVRNIKAKRAGRSGTTYVRFAHEMTGNWYPWSVTSSNVGDFKTSWRLFSSILKKEYPGAKLVFCPNDDNQSGVSVDTVWPGDAYVDVVGPDSYDGYPDRVDAASWDRTYLAMNNGPRGVGAWLAFAKAHGKPLAFPEWGLRTSDNPYFVQKMHAFLAGCAPKPSDTSVAGKCIYDVYFNIANGGNERFVIYGGPNPKAAAAYRALTWGTR